MHKILAKDIMVAQPYTIDINEDFAVAWDIFRLRKIRHLPVLINGRLLIGVLSLTDLYRLISPHSTKTGTLIYDVNELNRFKLKEGMTKK
ncbi:MAG: CBS domain-containing protein, partial [Candidatus Omnitrophica bacterium]|nr:CBS domain-containing protein [Candidatus Omnitrophota bacterium]